MRAWGPLDSHDHLMFPKAGGEGFSSRVPAYHILVHLRPTCKRFFFGQTSIDTQGSFFSNKILVCFVCNNIPIIFWICEPKTTGGDLHTILSMATFQKRRLPETDPRMTHGSTAGSTPADQDSWSKFTCTLRGEHLFSAVSEVPKDVGDFFLQPKTLGPFKPLAES